ncbi:ribosome silencing factor [Piscinibacter terrae]|uniref:Ribosomal silencing factor RsfS n=1 Tax=Piscinibacter terrae TaxID=2496871 RepID=A0A3N7HTS7_9BURK|nr:ribosome silencing factor [Albitalea terrae]RQP25728.1 ribosome silencing factor [Albitalea terrae]
MDIRKLQRAIVDGLEDVKGQNIVVFNTEHLSPLFERVVIASGTSNRQTKALAFSVRDAVKKKGFPVMRTEGEDNGEWIIVDCGAAVVHVMQPAIRDYYHLEEIWGEKPVKLKLDGKATRLVKAEGSDDDEDDEPAPAAKKAPAKKVAAKKAAPAKPAAAKPTAAKAPAAKAPAKTAAKKVVARKAPAKKAAAPRAGVTRTVGVKSAAAKTTAAKKAPAKKAPAKKAAAKKTSSRA